MVPTGKWTSLRRHRLWYRLAGENRCRGGNGVPDRLPALGAAHRLRERHLPWWSSPRGSLKGGVWCTALDDLPRRGAEISTMSN